MKKRQCTLQLAITGEPEDPQPRAAVIFRGEGKTVSAAERLQYDERVEVLWQKKAWMDRGCQHVYLVDELGPWLEEHFKDAESGEILETLGLCDSLDAQKSYQFNEECRKFRHRPYHGPASETEHWQPIDAGGIGALVKSLLRIAQDEWLMKSKNWRRWSQGTLSAGERRILTTKWLADAWETVCKDYKHALRKAWDKSGSGVTIDGSNDHLIVVKGRPDWKPPRVSDDLRPEPGEAARKQMAMWEPLAQEEVVDEAAEPAVPSDTDASSDDSSTSDSDSDSASDGSAKDLAEAVNMEDMEPKQEEPVVPEIVHCEPEAPSSDEEPLPQAAQLPAQVVEQIQEPQANRRTVVMSRDILYQKLLKYVNLPNGRGSKQERLQHAVKILSDNVGQPMPTNPRAIVPQNLNEFLPELIFQVLSVP